MLKHSVIEIFKTLGIKEISRLTNFISSPYFNKSKKIISLYNRILNFYPEFSDKQLNRESIGKFINKDGVYKDSELRDYLSKLLVLVNEFLIYERLNVKVESRKLMLLNELAERDLNVQFEKQYFKFKEELNFNGYERDLFLNDFYLNTQLFNNLMSNTKVRKSKQAFTEVEIINNCAQNISIFHYVSLVSIFSNLLIHKRKFNVDFNSEIWEKLIEQNEIQLSEVATLSPYEQKFIQLYSYHFNTFKDFDDYGFYEKYKKEFNSIKDNLSYEEIKFHNSRLISYCIIQKKYQGISDSWNNELHGLYDEFLENKFYLSKQDKYLSHDLYRNILINAVNTNNVDWLSRFIKEYSSMLNPKFRENMKKYALAYLYHMNKNFTKSLELISNINPDYFIYKYDIRNLKLIVFFELNDMVGIIDLIHSYKEALNKDNLLGNASKVKYKKFLYYIKKLIDNSENQKELEYFHMKLKSEHRVTYKKWLLEKYKEILLAN